MEGQAGPKPGERSWPARLRLSLSFSFCSSSSLSSSASSSHSLARRPSHFYFVCAALRCSLFLSHFLALFFALPPPLSLSLLRRAKMVHGRSRTPISPRILRGGSTSTPLYPAPLLPVLPLYSPRFFASAAFAGAPRFFSAVFLSLCTRLHRSPF